MPLQASDVAIGCDVHCVSDISPIGVEGKYTPISGGDDKISVNLSYDDLTFTYSEGSKGTWNPQTHVYDGVMAPH